MIAVGGRQSFTVYDNNHLRRLQAAVRELQHIVNTAAADSCPSIFMFSITVAVMMAAVRKEKFTPDLFNGI